MMVMDVKTVLARMTLEEKASLCSGADMWRTKPVARLGIPPVMMADGPHGLRKQSEKGGIGIGDSVPSTCFPTAAAMACSWDRGLVREIGEALGRECREQGVSVLLGPGANIKRSPLCGRNFEYYSEDPFLTGEMAAAWIAGLQSQGVGASLKHFAVNNQESRRMCIDAVVDERALREIYLAGFEAAMKKARPWTVMCAYNRLNGVFCSENRRLLSEILRDEWGFDGVVVTDWGACNDRVAGLAAGQDLEMPSSGGLNDRRIVKAVKGGRLDEAVLDRAVERLLNLISKCEAGHEPVIKADMDAHHALARRAAAECAVLLKNNGGLLPLSKDASIAVIGAFAVQPRYQGAGSSQINPTRMDKALDEIRKYAPGCTYSPGYREGSDDPDEALIAQACDAARAADISVVFAGLPPEYESEGFDRNHMRMPASHSELIRRVARANPSTAVVLMKGAPIEMPWADSAAAILDAYLGGQGGGGGVADVLFGAVNPSGKLAETIPLKLEDALAGAYFPMGPETVEYRESVFVGYRWFEASKTPVRYPFGHGLSYTSFEYSGMTLDKRSLSAGDGLTVSLSVRNAGGIPGVETVQLYIRDVESTAYRPEKELKGFEKVRLMPGEERRVTFTLDRRSFAFYDAVAADWLVEDGDFELLAGSSSADIRLRETVRAQTDRPDAIPADLRDAAPEYYGLPNASVSVGDASFEAVLGRRPPERHRPEKARFTLNSTLDDVRRTLPGGLLYTAMCAGIKRMMGAGKNKPEARMLERFVGEMPLRGLVTMSRGKFPPELMKFVLGLMNVGRG